jgi:hypothetical protein
MNKQFEAGLLVAVAVLVTMSAATMYQVNAKPNTNPVDRYVVHEWQALSHWMKNSVTRANTAGAAHAVHSAPVPNTSTYLNTESAQTKVQKNQQPGTSIPAVPAFGTNTDQFEPGNADTYRKLAQIGAEFVDSMNQSDWQTLGEALSKDSPQQASAVVVGMIQSHVPAGDRAWLAQHFQGSQDFNEEDVSLLQSSVQQAMSELTPEEVSLLSQALPSVSSVIR